MNEHDYDNSHINSDSAAEHVETESNEVQKTKKHIAAFDKLVEWFIDYDPYEVRDYVENLRKRFPDLSNDELAERVTSLKAFKNGLVGAATGIPGFLALPLTVPADLLMTWKIQINLALCIAYIYGEDLHEKDREALKTDIYMILAGKSATECLKVLGVNIDTVTRKAVKRYVNRELMTEIWKQIARQIAMRTGRRTYFKLSRMMPLIGGPIGFASDYAATKSVGAFAKDYYRDSIVDVSMN